MHNKMKTNPLITVYTISFKLRLLLKVVCICVCVCVLLLLLSKYIRPYMRMKNISNFVKACSTFRDLL